MFENLMCWKPGASKRWLYILAGLMWMAVGILLIRFAYQWLVPTGVDNSSWFLFGGIGLACMIYHWGFSRLANKNIFRIESLRVNTPCIFAFQLWTSYPLVIVMISMGIYLRKFSTFPKVYLASLYIGIGGSLFLASLHYFIKILREVK